MTGAYLMTPAQKRDIPHLLWTATSWDCNLLWTPHMLNNFTIFTRFCPPKDCSKRVTDALETGLSSTVSTADMSRSHVWLLPIARLCTFKLNCNYNSYRNLMAYAGFNLLFLPGGWEVCAVYISITRNAKCKANFQNSHPIRTVTWSMSRWRGGARIVGNMHYAVQAVAS